MKKYFLSFLVLASLCSTQPIMAQASLGADIGLNISNIRVDGLLDAIEPNRDFITTFRPQLTALFPLDDRLSVYTGVGYERRGFNAFVGKEVNFLGISIPLGVTVKTRVNFVEVPLQVKIDLLPRDRRIIPWVQAGANFGYAINGELKTQLNVILNLTVNKTPLNMQSNNVNRFDIAPAITLGMDVPYGNGAFTLALGFEHSVQNFINDSTIGVETRHFGFNPSFGYRHYLRPVKKSENS